MPAPRPLFAVLALCLGCGAGTPTATPDAGGPGCDLVHQNCPNSARCVTAGPLDDRANVCLPSSGSLPPLAPCAAPDRTQGADDCARGTLCTRLGDAATGAARCRTLCNTHSDCAAGDRCHRLSTRPGSVGGVCLPNCVAFKNTCTTGSFCQYYPTPELDQYAGACTAGAPRAPGDGCPDGRCGPDQSCTPTLPHRCVSVCDAAHPCPDGHACTLDPLFAPGIGTCG